MSDHWQRIKVEFAKTFQPCGSVVIAIIIITGSTTRLEPLKTFSEIFGKKVKLG